MSAQFNKKIQASMSKSKLKVILTIKIKIINSKILTINWYLTI